MKTRVIPAIVLFLLVTACIPVTINIGQAQPVPTQPIPTPFIETANRAMPDLTITSSLISMVDGNGNCLGGYGLNAAILNQGTAPAADVVVEELMSGHLIFVGTLDPQQSMILQFPASPNGKYRIMIDPQNQIAESDEANNIVTPPSTPATPPGYCLPDLIRTPTPTPYDLDLYTPSSPASIYFPLFTAPASWRTYSNPHPAYMIQYPPDATLDQQAERLIINLPFEAGTQMIEKSIRIETRIATAEECSAQFPWEGTTLVNGVEMKYSGGKQWTQGLDNLVFVGGDYAVHHKGFCYRIYLFMGVRNDAASGASPLPTPGRADMDFEILLNIISTFRVQ